MIFNLIFIVVMAALVACANYFWYGRLQEKSGYLHLQDQSSIEIALNTFFCTISTLHGLLPIELPIVLELSRLGLIFFM